MPLNGHQSVYKTTTTSATGDYSYPDNGYLARTISPGCCSGSRKRQQILLVAGSVICLAISVLLFVLGVSGRSVTVLVFVVILSVILLASSIYLFTLYLRTKGHCNLPCWPNRAAIISRTLMEEPETPVQSVIVSGDDPSVREVVLDEKINLMEAEDEAGERITKSQPKIVLMDVGSAT